MPSKPFLILSLIVLAALNYAIFAKEQIIGNGQTVLLELAPVDPRSLMQGDYMRLAYAIERQAGQRQASGQEDRRGWLVIQPDAKQIAQFIRFHEGETLQAGELLIRYHARYGGVEIVPDAFFFQEGHAELYARAKYGEFKFGKGEHVLVGLRDADGKRLGAAE